MEVYIVKNIDKKRKANKMKCINCIYFIKCGTENKADENKTECENFKSRKGKINYENTILVS